MKREIEYIRRVLSLPRGKMILFGQALLIASMMVLFIKMIPWIMSTDISKMEQIENPTPPPPSWAKAFSVNHGTFRYYEETRSDAPMKFWGTIAGILGSTIMLKRWIKWAAKRGEDRNKE